MGRRRERPRPALERLVPVHVECSGCHVARLERAGQRVLVDELASRGVHQQRTRAHLAQRGRVKHLFGRGT